MEAWERAAKNFLEQSPFAADIKAAFLTGSYARGTADAYSDVDVYIVLDDTVDWRERGNKRVNEFLIEYFANPVRQIKRYLASSYSEVDLTEVSMIMDGVPIMGDASDVEEIRKLCLDTLAVPFPVLSNFSIQNNLYHLWDKCDELKRAYTKDSADFAFQYYLFGEKAIRFYSRFIKCPIPTYPHFHSWLFEGDSQKDSMVPEYKDPVFINLAKEYFLASEPEIQFDCSKKMYDYIVDACGGFDINDFVLRSELDV